MEKKNKYLANLMAGNVLLHNLHWNVEGKAFKQVHEFLEFLYDDVFAKFDEVAERMKMDGVLPPASMKQYMEMTDIKELEVRAYPIQEAFEQARKYLLHMRHLALAIRKDADEKDIFWWANMMEEHVEGYDKVIWFINQSLCDGFTGTNKMADGQSTDGHSAHGGTMDSAGAPNMGGTSSSAGATGTQGEKR